MGDADDTADTTCLWDGEEVVEQLGGCWEAVGPPTALQKPGGVDGGRNWELRMWRGVLRVGGRWPFERFCGSSGLGFTVDCHLIEMFNINCFLNAGKKRRKHIIRPKAIFYRAVENGSNNIFTPFILRFLKNSLIPWVGCSFNGSIFLTTTIWENSIS